jgi:hypothetical protein
MATSLSVGKMRRASTSKAPKVSAAPSVAIGPDGKTEADYRAEDDFRTLERGEEVRGDAQRHQRALAHGRKKVAAMGKILGQGRQRSAPRR